MLDIQSKLQSVPQFAERSGSVSGKVDSTHIVDGDFMAEVGEMTDC